MYKVALNRLSVLDEMCSIHGNSYMAQATNWYRLEWSGPQKYRGRADEVLNVLDARKKFIDCLPPDCISRSDVFNIFIQISTGELNVEDALIAAMIWGHRPHSLGPYRTTVMLSKPRFGRTVHDVLSCAIGEVSGDPLKGYEALQNKLEMLGPSYGTKFLYFASPELNRAPIFDSYVAKWLNKFEVQTKRNVGLSVNSWNLSNYKLYLEFCHRALGHINHSDSGYIEYLIFIDSRYGDYLLMGQNFPAWIRGVTQLD